MLTRLAHICLHARDLKRTRAFYQDVLGLGVKFTFEKEGAVVGMYFELGGDSFIEVFERKDGQVLNTGITHFCLETADLDAFLTRLREHGVPHGEKRLGADHSYQAW